MAQPASHVDFGSELEASGFALRKGFVGADTRARLLTLLDPERVVGAVRYRSGRAFAIRDVLWSVPRLREELELSGVNALASAALGGSAFPIDATFFDKCAAANWSVPSHQDRVFPIAENAGGVGRRRGGVLRAELDEGTLSELVALRVHFDVTDGLTGALCVVPCSHTAGVLSLPQIRALTRDHFVPCPAAVGDVLFLRPLLLHRSSPSLGEGQRRVLHVVYASRPPRGAARWRGAA